MFARNKRSAGRAVMAVLAIISLFVCTIRCDQLGLREGTSDDQQQQQQVLVTSGTANLLSRHNNRILAVPRSLARFLFYNARQAGGEHPVAIQSSGQPHQRIGGGNAGQLSENGGYERSSRALDAISGMTIGKRSANPLDYVNLEPIYGRQNYVVRAPAARVYDMRWAPLDTIESTNGYRDYNNNNNN